MLLYNNSHALSNPRIKGEGVLCAPLAEYEFSDLIKVYYKFNNDKNGKSETKEYENCSNTYLIDAEVIEGGVTINSGTFGVNLEENEVIIFRVCPKIIS